MQIVRHNSNQRIFFFINLCQVFLLFIQCLIGQFQFFVGIQGYVLKSIGTNELLEAIQAVAAGGTYFSREPGINRELNDYKSTINIGEERIDQILSKREIEVLKLICREYSNADIAARLFLSVSTVETHRKNLIAKLGVNNTVGLVKFALRHGLID